jgi:DNA-binding LytR/AlgR family response regulator
MPEPLLASSLRCLAVDDEPFALKLMGDDIAKVPFLKVAGLCSSTKEAADQLKKNAVDLLFLDIQMPGQTGTQFLRTLSNPPMVIFTTAFEKYALEGFELDVIDYLVKPIPFERFLKAVNKAREQFDGKKNHVSVDTFFFVRAEYKEIKIFFDDILYVEGLKDYVKIFLASQPRPVMTRMNLKAIEARLPSQLFCRIHNSFIIPFSKIGSFQRSQVFIGQTAIPVGDKYADAFRRKYGTNP